MIPVLSDIVVLLALASIVLIVSHRLRIPTIIGYLITGILIGPHGLELVSATESVEIMAEIGVVLLLFTIGLEISFEALWQMRRTALGGGFLQVTTTTACGILLFSAFGAEAKTALFAGFFVALSSTAMVLKLLQERGESYSPQGRASISILLFQDLAVVPMMLIIPALAGALEGFSASIGVQLLKGAGVLVLLAGARWVVPRLLHLVVRTRSREAFAFTVIVICLAIAWLTEAAHLSLALGAFLAGVIISESEYSHDALATVLPFRHIFATIFFVSMGMLINVGFVIESWPLVLSLFLGVVIVKAALVMLALVVLKYPPRIAILAGLGLAQVGEFSFVLLQSASSYGVVTEEVYQVLLAVALLTLAATPFLMHVAPSVASMVRAPVDSRAIEPRKGKLEDHLVIAGYGVGGKNVARAARSCGIPYVILEMNAETVRAVRKTGEPIRYGDAVNEGGLRACDIETARVMVVAISDPAATRQVLSATKKLNPAIHLIARTRYIKELPALMELGADQVIPEEFEASVEMFTRVLAAYLVPRSDIESVASEIRSEGYQMLRKPGSAAFTIRGTELSLPDIEVSSFKVLKGAPLENRTLAEVDLRNRYRATVLALRRGEEISAHPRATETIHAGDVLVIMGTVHALADLTGLFDPESGEKA
jgi:CPA2 family monovalent cation:H+ antiporter-2